MATESRAAEVGVLARGAGVLAASAEHLTNAETAGQLFVSVRTVEQVHTAGDGIRRAGGGADCVG